jgi:hypothetical protein
MKKTTIGDHQYRRLTTLVNSTSTAPPISLLPKGAEFCHTIVSGPPTPPCLIAAVF